MWQRRLDDRQANAKSTSTRASALHSLQYCTVLSRIPAILVLNLDPHTAQTRNQVGICPLGCECVPVYRRTPGPRGVARADARATQWATRNRSAPTAAHRDMTRMPAHHHVVLAALLLLAHAGAAAPSCGSNPGNQSVTRGDGSSYVPALLDWSGHAVV